MVEFQPKTGKRLIQPANCVDPFDIILGGALNGPVIESILQLGSKRP